jgi:hypothetical protein
MHAYGATRSHAASLLVGWHAFTAKNIASKRSYVTRLLSRWGLYKLNSVYP